MTRIGEWVPLLVRVYRLSLQEVMGMTLDQLRWFQSDLERMTRQ